MTTSRPAPNVTTPSRLPRRAAKRPTTSAAPSATSALRRSAVPKCIDGELVEQEPRGQLPVRHVLADLRDERPGGGVPVDLADVVAGLVRTDAVELQAGAVAATEVVAAHLAADPPVERQLELADEPVGDRAGPGPGRRPVAPADAGQVGGRRSSAGPRRGRPDRRRHAVGSTAISRRGAGTSERTRSMIVSAVIPSARAA